MRNAQIKNNESKITRLLPPSTCISIICGSDRTHSIWLFKHVITEQWSAIDLRIDISCIIISIFQLRLTSWFDVMWLRKTT